MTTANQPTAGAANKMTLARQIEDLNARRAALHAELVGCSAQMVGTEWHTDRVNELAYLNGRLVVLVGRMAE